MALARSAGRLMAMGVGWADAESAIVVGEVWVAELAVSVLAVGTA
jgi:hypothetical protein